MNNFAENLKKLRTDKDTLQKDLAKLLDITIRQYQRYETGKSEPNIDALITIADYFKVPLDDLVGRPDILIKNEDGKIMFIEAMSPYEDE